MTENEKEKEGRRFDLVVTAELMKILKSAGSNLLPIDISFDVGDKVEIFIRKRS